MAATLGTMKPAKATLDKLRDRLLIGTIVFLVMLTVGIQAMGANP